MEIATEERLTMMIKEDRKIVELNVKTTINSGSIFNQKIQ